MSEATLSIRAHYDGKFIVPDEPVSLPVNAPLQIEVRQTNGVSDIIKQISSQDMSPEAIARRLAAFDRFCARAVNTVPGGIPAEALRRENMYGDDER
jgi:hypothetical protein